MCNEHDIYSFSIFLSILFLFQGEIQRINTDEFSIIPYYSFHVLSVLTIFAWMCYVVNLVLKTKHDSKGEHLQ